MARLRRLAMARGAVPVRTWEASSAKAVSRRWCDASMPQWPRIQSAGYEPHSSPHRHLYLRYNAHLAAADHHGRTGAERAVAASLLEQQVLHDTTS